MTLFRRPVATKRRRRILDVTNYWRTDGPVPMREVVIRDYDGEVRRILLPDAHPALVAWIEQQQRAAVAA